METISDKGLEDKFLIESLKNNCQLIIDGLDKNNNYVTDLISLVEDSKYLADLYSSTDNVGERMKYDSMAESALRQLNKYLFD
jgi:hypothetical protein